MNGFARKGITFSIVIALAFLLGAPLAEARLVPKIDNFIILQDQSGSMYMTYPGTDMTKMAMSKKILLAMNDLIPDLGYQGAVYLVAPFQQVLAPTAYNKAAFAEAIQSIPDNQEIYGRTTPLGMGINNLDAVLAGMPGRTGIILISDGKENMCTNPVAEARAIADKYQVCFHVISLADEAEGAAILQQINQLRDCCNAIGLDLLKDPALLDQFVRCVFYDEAVEEEVIVLRGIHFDFDKYNIKPEWVPVLEEAVAILRDNPSMNVIIEGHTDSVGTEAYNQGLSERRARSVYNFFRQNGIAAARLQTVGYGESRPIASNDTEEGRALNRRVELKVVGAQ
jgi:OmpA-OmpF porin, OOP family